jgi:membrane protein DedA with SNARE-associated domain
MHMHRTISFSDMALTLVNHLGVAGVAVGVFLNGLSIPGLGETLLPLGGVAVRQGKMNLLVLLVVAMAAQLAGLSLAYAIGRFGGVALLERYGKYVFIRHRELKKMQQGFDRYGSWLVLVGAFVPGIQGLIGYAAGIAEMNYGKFLLSSFLGKTVWIGGLVGLGMAVGSNLGLIDRSIKQLSMVVLAGLVTVVVWYLYHHRRQRMQSATTEEN